MGCIYARKNAFAKRYAMSSKLALPTRPPYAIRGEWGGLVPHRPAKQKIDHFYQCAILNSMLEEENDAVFCSHACPKTALNRQKWAQIRFTITHVYIVYDKVYSYIYTTYIYKSKTLSIDYIYTCRDFKLKMRKF